MHSFAVPAMDALAWPTTESELRALAWATLLTPALAAYARLASRRFRPGLPRFAALFPTFPFFVYLPFILPLLPFVLCAGFPIKVRRPLDQSKKQHDPRSSSPPPPVADFFRPCARSALLLGCIAAVYPYTGWLPLYALHYIYCAQIFLTLDLVLSSAALVSASLLGASLEPQFSAPLAADSLAGFWGRQWNLMAVDVLRASAYEPVRARWGRDAGVLAAFLMSGLLHELLYFYMTLRRPTGEMLRFFVFHGVFQIVERRAREAGLWRPPRLVAYLLVSGFMLVTISEMFFGPFVRAGTEARLQEEASAMLDLVWSVARCMIRPFGLISAFQS
ncbi:hypothetical protein QOZ80_1AG0026760 [Eleusine coracana subsp. coracana]|nr:hypothetical protein QOZ80_1AG0026760 [Eleusine coracana subsp. coracana]